MTQFMAYHSGKLVAVGNFEHASKRLAAARDSDGSPKGRDAQRLDGEAATARAGTASHETSSETPK